MPTSNSGSGLLLALLATTLCGCVAESGFIERLEGSGVTIARDREPLVFARTEARYSRSARDYLYLGPVETNRQGIRDYYLWVGVATTLDRGYLAPAADAPELFYVTVLGEPIELRLQAWSDLHHADGGQVYATPVALQRVLAARVTLQQLQLIAEHAPASVAVASSRGGDTREYFRWDTDRSWSDFLAAVTRRNTMRTSSTTGSER
jgi:hypothetical protein